MKRGFSAAIAISGLTHLPLTPAIADIGEQATGIVRTGPATVLIAIALGIVLTLIGRPLIAPIRRSAAHWLLRRRLLRTLRAAGAECLHDFILPGPSGGLVSIDIAVRVPGGVVCLQVKHYRGTIFTNNEGTQWNVVSGSRRHRFMNPVLQNESRVQAIRHAVPGLPATGLVVFAAPVNFPDRKPQGIVTLAELKNALEDIEFDAADTEAVDDWEATWLRLKASALTDDDSRKDLDAQVSFG